MNFLKHYEFHFKASIRKKAGKQMSGHGQSNDYRTNHPISVMEKTSDRKPQNSIERGPAIYLLQEDDGKKWKEKLKRVTKNTVFYKYFFPCTYRLVRRTSPQKNDE